jgi:hypothetical protein
VVVAVRVMPVGMVVAGRVVVVCDLAHAWLPSLAPSADSSTQ